MDEYTNRRAVNGHQDSRHATTLVSKRTPRSVTQTAKLGCINRQNVATGSRVMRSENHSASKNSLDSAKGGSLAGVGSSSSTNGSARRLWEPLRKPIARVEKVMPENASSSSNANDNISNGLEVTGDVPLLANHVGDCVSGKEVVQTIEPSLSVRTENNLNGKQVLTDLAGSTSSSSTKFKISQTNVPRLSHRSSKYFSKGYNYKCNSDVDSRVHRRLGILDKGNDEGESSSSRMKKTRPVRIGETSGSAHGKSVEELRKHLYRTRNVLESNSSFVGTRRSTVSIREPKPANKEYGNNTLQDESNVSIQGQNINGHEVPVNNSASSTTESNSFEHSMHHPVTGGNSISSLDLSIASGLMDQGGFPRHLDSITEVNLLDLEFTLLHM